MADRTSFHLASVVIGTLGTVLVLLIPPAVLLSPLILVVALFLAVVAGPGRTRALAIGATIGAAIGVGALAFLLYLYR
jgi:hypothetical protein